MNSDPLVQRALDQQAIIDVTIAYTWCLDMHDWDGLDAVFLPDATALLGTERVGIDSIKERVRGALTPLDASQHIVSNHQVRIDGDNATCRCYFQAQHVRKAASGTADPAGGENFIVAGRYEDRLVRTADGWRIARRELIRMWSQGNTDVLHLPR